MIFKGKLARRRKAISVAGKIINKSIGRHHGSRIYELKWLKTDNLCSTKSSKRTSDLTSELYKTKASAENGIASV